MIAIAKAGRGKAPALAVPQSATDADALIREYGEHATACTRIGAELAAKSAALKAAAEAEAGPHQEALKLLLKRLQAFAEARRDELTKGGKTKTVELPAGILMWRTRPPSVVVAKGKKLDDIVAWLLDGPVGLRRLFIRHKFELNKEALLEHADRAAEVPDIRIQRDVEDFHVIPAGLELTDVKT